MRQTTQYNWMQTASVLGCILIGCAPSPSGTVWSTPPSTATECAAPCVRDQDGILDPDDNCPDVANPQQTDRDYDDRGDLCDAQPDMPNYKFSKSSVHITPRMTDGKLMLQTQTKYTPHESDDGHYRMQIGVGL